VETNAINMTVEAIAIPAIRTFFGMSSSLWLSQWQVDRQTHTLAQE
jgi:hypothetical protein